MKCKKLTALVCIGYPDFPAAKFLEVREFHSDENLKRYIDVFGKNIHPRIKRQPGLKIAVYQARKKINEYSLGDEKTPYKPMSLQSPTFIFGYLPSEILDLNNNKEVLEYLHGTPWRHLEIVPDGLPNFYIGEF